MPVAHLESDIIRTTDKNTIVLNKTWDTPGMYLSNYKACLKLHYEIVGNHVVGDARALRADMEIPIKCLAHKKVFLNLDQADIEEKGETD